MSAIAVIPARYASKRFPGKVLADRTGKPLIQHVYERVREAKSISRVIIAADDERIRKACEQFGAEVVMTRTDHANGTSRIAEALEILSTQYSALRTPDRIIVNVQGDEPEIEPRVIDLAVEMLLDRDDCVMSTVASPFRSSEAPADPNIVKVVVDQSGSALYFSRAWIPHTRDGATYQNPYLKHVGIYAYRAEFLEKFIALPPTPLEQSEQLEQLRALEHGHRIAVAITETDYHGIDTPQQYDAFVARHRARA